MLFMWTRKHVLTGKNLKNLDSVVKFCLNLYVKLHFDIKVKHDLIHGPGDVLNQGCILGTLPKEVQTTITPYIRSGARYSHTECISYLY